MEDVSQKLNIIKVDKYLILDLKCGEWLFNLSSVSCIKVFSREVFRSKFDGCYQVNVDINCHGTDTEMHSTMIEKKYQQEALDFIKSEIYQFFVNDKKFLRFWDLHEALDKHLDTVYEDRKPLKILKFKSKEDLKDGKSPRD